MNQTDKKLEKLEKLIQLLNQSVSKDDFIQSFQKVIDFAKEIKNKNETDFTTLREWFVKEFANIKDAGEADILKMKELATATLREQIINSGVALKPSTEVQKITIEGINVITLKGDKGDSVQGPPGKDSTVPGPKGDKGERGEPGESVQGEAGKDGSPDSAEQVRDKLETLKENERLDKSAIKGLEGIEENIKQLQIRPTGRGGGKGFTLYTGGTKRLLTAQTLNIVGGAGITISYAYASGRNDITITATGSASLTPITVTGTINDSNVTFTAASTPNLVMVNGAAYRSGHGVTIVGTAITLDNPVGTGGDIYCI